MLAILRRSVVGVLKAREPEVGQGDLHGPVGRAVAEHVRGLHIAVDGGVPRRGMIRISVFRYVEDPQTLGGSFSAVSTSIFASK